MAYFYNQIPENRDEWRRYLEWEFRAISDELIVKQEQMDQQQIAMDALEARVSALELLHP